MAPPQARSPYAAEGTVAHSLAEELVTGKVDSLELMSRIGSTVKCDGFDIEVTEAMVDGAIEYHDVIAADRKALELLGKPAAIHGEAEARVCAKSVDSELWGTADYILFQRGGTLFVYDYKFGQGVIVDPEENEQACIYAVAAMDGKAGWAFDKVVIKIVQPRGNHIDGTVREWVTTPKWLEGFRDRLRPAVEETRNPAAKVEAGDWCRWCTAKPFCPALYKEVQAQAHADFDVVMPAMKKEAALAELPNVRLLPTEKLAKILSWKEAIEAYLLAVKDVVREKLTAGEAVPGWKLVDGRSNRQWQDEEKVIAEFEPVLGRAALFAPPKLLSPAKIEKLVGKKYDLSALTYKPEAEKSVARDTDPRPAARSSAVDDFVGSTPAPKCEECEMLGVCDAHKTAGLEAELAGGAKTPIWPV